MFKPAKEKTFKESPKENLLCKEVAEVVTCLMNASISLHKLHLKVTGMGSKNIKQKDSNSQRTLSRSKAVFKNRKNYYSL